MTFLEFKEKFFGLACFNIHQIYAWQPNFDRNNLTRWVEKKYLFRLRQGYYAFTEFKSKRDYPLYFANKIYRPSYISLHTALAFYGLIPEVVVQITSVSSLKTAVFNNDSGEYSYRKVKENLMFGFELKNMADNKTILFATAEKALLDLLYLYPFYNNPQELEQLRLDEDYMHENLNLNLLNSYLSLFQNKALKQRVRLLYKVYSL